MSYRIIERLLRSPRFCAAVIAVTAIACLAAVIVEARC
jgi:hypothetical protein